MFLKPALKGSQKQEVGDFEAKNFILMLNRQFLEAGFISCYPLPVSLHSLLENCQSAPSKSTILNSAFDSIISFPVTS